MSSLLGELFGLGTTTLTTFNLSSIVVNFPSDLDERCTVSATGVPRS